MESRSDANPKVHESINALPQHQSRRGSGQGQLLKAVGDSLLAAIQSP
jgi:hypothetical protein